MTSDFLAFLEGGGEMGGRIRAFDWGATPLGPAASWSPALRTTLRIMLANRFPHILWWGPHYIQFYNDAYRPIPGAKHPHRVLGRPGSECWSEIWHVIGPLIDTPFRGGPPTWDEDILLQIDRHGFLEESHFTIAYSPVPDETAPGGIGGVLATVHEITEKVVGERRVVALRDLGGRLGDAKSAEEACAFAAQVLLAHDRDVPFALFYLLEADGTRARLVGCAGADPAEEKFAPASVDLSAPRSEGWPLHEAKTTGLLQEVTHLGGRFRKVPAGPWSDPPHSAVVVPIPSNKPNEIAALMIAGVSSRLRWNDFYRDFFELVRTQVASAIANARAYEEEKRRAEALTALDRAKTAFFSNVSHEFRTPLTLMLGPVDDILARDGAALLPAVRRDLEMVQRNGGRLQRLVNTMLDFSRIEAGRMRARYQATDLSAFTADLASVFRAAAERAGLDLLVDCAPLDEPVYVDRDMWEKIVLNLLSNAFKFTFEGTIAVALRAGDDGAVVLEVKDTGTGIPEEEMPRLFERFHRVQNARGRTHEGSGIGLALVQELVRLHGGRIAASSRPGVGTTFTVELPLGSTHLPAGQVVESPTSALPATGAWFVEEAIRWLPDVPAESGEAQALVPSEGPATGPAPAAAGAVSAEAADAEARPLVLVADDNADMRQYLVRLLSERYRTAVAGDGEAALESAARERPDLILTDVMMPRLDGFGLMQRLRADPATRDVPILMLSARAGEESRVEGMEAGADDYLVKPFGARELLARVSGHLQMARLRRETAEALRLTYDRFEKLIDGAPLGVYLVDADLRIVQVNPKARPAFGDIKNLIGSDFSEVMHILWPKAYAEEIVERFRQTLRSGEPFFVAERSEESLDRGGTEYYEWQIHRIGLPDGRHGVVCYFSDISRHVLARRALAESDRRKNEFMAVLAHELRNPLAPLRNALQVMKLAGEDARAMEEARLMMERQVALLVRLIDDLMDMSRINRGKVVLRRETMEIAAAVRLAVETSRPEMEARGQTFVVEVPSVSLPVHGDLSRLAQIFANLLNNAAKYSEPGGRVRLTVSRVEQEAVVRIRDTGIGIPAEMLPRVFDLFTQVDRSLEKAQGGLGIGLSLVKGFVEMHDGTIAVRSDGPGQGSEFTVRLPIHEPDRERAEPIAAVREEGVAETPVAAASPVPPAAPEPAPVLSQEPTGRRRVLIVDDNKDAASSLAKLLHCMGNETQMAHDGLEAIGVAETFRPDLVMLDIGMPRLSGYDTARRIREQPWGRSMVLVALSGWGQEEDRRRSRDAGFDSHLVKPLEPETMERLLAGLDRPAGA
jgi:PAS domain S-box-containing protein